MAEHLTTDFLTELFKLCFLKREILEVVSNHLKYEYIPSDNPEIKKVYKSIITHYSIHSELPTYGYVSQQHSEDIDVQQYLHNIKKTTVPRVDIILEELEDYIKQMRFQLLFSKVKRLYNDDKPDEAMKLNAKEGEEIVRFSLKVEGKQFLKLFRDFDDKMNEKQIRDEAGEFDQDRLPTGITVMDEEIFGGIDIGDTALFLARSGGGKSTLLKSIGVYACRLGYDILHIQLEGSKEECFDKYTQSWTALKYNQVKYGRIPNTEYKDNDGKLIDTLHNKLDKVINRMVSQHKDVDIYAFEMFDEATCFDVRNVILEYEKVNGKFPDAIIIDSLDLLHPGDGLKYGIDTNSIKYKKENTSKKLKNIATEFRTRIITVDQADNIPKNDWNDPHYYMTRNNVSGAKNLANAFSYFVTINRTEAEEKNGHARLYFDKLRNYFPQNRKVQIATNFAAGRFYDPVKTKELIAKKKEEEEKESNKNPNNDYKQG